MSSLTSFLKDRNIAYLTDGDISPYLTMRVGGKVRLIITVKSRSEFRELLLRLIENRQSYVIIGGGSNVVFPSGYSPIAVIINRTSDIAIGEGGMIRVNSGMANHQLLRWCVENGLSGLEFLAGIPGTIGGAAAVNAGAFQKSMADTLTEAEIMDSSNRFRRVKTDYFQYRYRDSVFRTGNQAILDLYFNLKQEHGETIQKQIDSHLDYRRRNHPSYNQYTAGCFFKNPLVGNRRVSAGRIIQDLGFEQDRFAPLRLSDRHANFLINQGEARIEDIRQAEKTIIERARQQKGICLEREVIYITPDGDKQ